MLGVAPAMQDIWATRRAQRRSPLQKSREATARNAPHACLDSGWLCALIEARAASLEPSRFCTQTVLLPMGPSGCPASSGDHRGHCCLGFSVSSRERGLESSCLSAFLLALLFGVVLLAFSDSPRRSLAELRRRAMSVVGPPPDISPSVFLDLMSPFLLPSGLLSWLRCPRGENCLGNHQPGENQQMVWREQQGDRRRQV